MAVQIFTESDAISQTKSYRWSFVYADGELEIMLGETDIFYSDLPKPKKDGYYACFFLDAEGKYHPCTAKLTDEDGCIVGIISLDNGRIYSHTPYFS